MELHGAVPIRDDELLLHIFGDVNEDGPRAAGGGEEERFFNHTRNVFHVQDEVIVLGDGSGNLDDGCLLEGVCADHAAGDLAGNGDEGDAVKESVSKAADEVGGARAGGGDADAGAARGTSVALGGEDLSLFMAAEDVTDGGGAGEGLMDLHRSAARVRKDHVNAGTLESLHQHVGAFPGLIRRETRDMWLEGDGGAGGGGGVCGVGEGVGDEDMTWRGFFGNLGK